MSPTPSNESDDMSRWPDPLHEDPPPRWTHRQRALGAVGWGSFLAACVASVVFFGIVDPYELATITTPTADITRMTGYAIGFFFFWAVTATAAAVAALLLLRR